MKKKAISILLTLALCLSLLPTAALAEDITWPSTGGTVTVDSVEYTYQGDYTLKYLDLSSSPTGNNIYQAGSGYALWNVTNKTVTLHNASITASTALEVPTGATVVVEGTNTLHATNSYALLCSSGGITVTGSGSLSTLTDSTGVFDRAVNADNGDISIDITGNFTSNGIRAQSGTVAVKSGGAVSITGLVRAGSSVTVEAGTNLSITNSANMAVQSVNSGGISLTAKNGNITVSGGNIYNQYAIQGTNGPVTLDASGEIQVADYNGYPGVKGSGLTVSGTIPAGTTLHSSCAVTVPEGKTLVNNGTLSVNSGGVSVAGRLIQGAGSAIKSGSSTIEPSIIGSGSITEAPQMVDKLDFRFEYNIPTTTKEYIISGGGTAKWEPASDSTPNKLTLNGVTMTGSSYVVGVPDNTEIVLIGNNKITAQDNAIYSNGTLKVSGAGSLEAVTTDSSGWTLYGATGIDVNISGALKVTGQIRANGGPLSVKSGGAIDVTGSMYGVTSITAEAGTSLSVVNNGGTAIFATNCDTVSLTAKDGNLTISGTHYGIFAKSSAALAIHASGTVSITGSSSGIQSGKTLELSGTIAENSELITSAIEALTIPANKPLTNNGTIKLGYTPATVTVSGTLINNGTILNGSGAPIEPTVNEGGVVAEKTDLDFTNRSADTTGAGYAWDKTSKTLTLTNYSMDDPCSGPSVILPDGAKLVLVGANTLQSRDGALIEAKGALDISGSGSLTGTAGGSAALSAQGDVTITDCTLNLTASSANSSVINTNTHALTIGGTANVTLTDTASTGWGVNTGHGGDFTLGSDAKLIIHAPVGILVGTGSGDTEIETVKIAGTLDTAGCTNMCASLLGVKLDMTGSSITMADNTHIWLYQKENTLTGETNIKAFNGLLKVSTGNGTAVDYYKVTKDDTLGLYAEGSTVAFTADTIDGKPFIGWTATGVELSNPTNATISFTMPGNDVTLTTSYAITVSGVSLDKSELSLTVGGTQTLTATVAPSDATNQAVTWSSSDPTIASVDENGAVTAQKAGIAAITVTTVDGGKTAVCTVTVQNPSSGGSSGGGSSSSSGTTTTEKNPDGSTTTTVTDKTTGTVTETTKNTDGSTTVVETKKDGTVTETNKTADGTTGTVVTDKNGDVTEVKSSVSSTAAKEAAKTGEAVTLPVEVPAVKTTGDAPAVDVTVPQSAGSVKVEIPVETVTPGTVAVIVNADGTEKIISTSVVTDNGVALTLDGNATVKVIDNSKNFIDVSKNNVFYGEISSMSAREIMIGKTEDTFDLHSSVTLNQNANVAGRIAGAVDVKDYNGGIAWGQANGLKTGNMAATRGDVLRALYVAAGSPTVTDTSILAQFKDPIPEDLKVIAAWAAQNGILKGNIDSKGNLTANLNTNVTRGQACALAGRTLNTIG